MAAHIATACPFVMSNAKRSDLPSGTYPRKQWLGTERGLAGREERVNI